MVPFGKRPEKLPAVLGGEEVANLLSCVSNIKHRTFLLTLYAAGLRLNEGRTADCRCELPLGCVDRKECRCSCGIPLAVETPFTDVARHALASRGVPVRRSGCSGPNVRRAAVFNDDSENVQGGRAESGYSEERHAAHAETFLRHRTPGGGRGPADDQSTAGAQELLNNASPKLALRATRQQELL